ncbi:unnamed protein product [Somion occarium]|uniref:N-acetyltransferase domain-containing protein n=1 Tax=Somion occarium TaxID=3059160 RepID=A0ABP1CZQ8_9APHY
MSEHIGRRSLHVVMNNGEKFGGVIDDFGTEPRMMTIVDIPRAATTSIETQVGDPVIHYVMDTPDDNDSMSKRLWTRFSAMSLWTNFIRKGCAWTIRAGEANLGYVDPTEDPGPIDKVLDLVFNAIYQSRERVNSKEQNRRYSEFKEKANKAIDKVIGNRRKEMLYLATIATTPAQQGHGYGTALVKVLTIKADLEARATWLVSSNVKDNTGFYNSLGFFTVGEFTLGDDNPTWHEAPFPVAIMLREPQNANEKVHIRASGPK